MLVVDTEKSERGPQRRKSGNRLLHCCCICGKLDVWREGWTYYASLKELDDADPIPKFCSDECASKGGPAALNVAEDMKRKAKESEWRAPEIVYREATDREKYAAAAHEQAREKNSLRPR